MISSVNFPLARGHFIPLSPAGRGLILPAGNNSEGNKANQAHWPIIRLSEAVDLGSTVSPYRSRTLGKIICHNTRGLQTQNYKECPNRPGGAREPCAARDADDEQMSWDLCRSLTKRRGGSVRMSGVPVPQQFDSSSFYLHTCCHGERQGNSLSPSLSGSHANTNTNNTHLHFPKLFLLTIIEESI